MAFDIYRVRTVWTNGIPGGGVSTHYFATTAPSTAGADAVLARVQAFWNAIKVLLHPTVAWRVDGLVDDLNYDTGQLNTSLARTSLLGSGSATGDFLPQATQGNIRWETGVILNGKRFRGRTYIPGMTEANSDGNPSAAAVTAVNSAVTAMDPTNGTLPLVVWHRPPAPFPSTGGQIRGVTTGALQPKFAVLRSRRD